MYREFGRSTSLSQNFRKNAKSAPNAPIHPEMAFVEFSTKSTQIIFETFPKMISSQQMLTATPVLVIVVL